MNTARTVLTASLMLAGLVAAQAEASPNKVPECKMWSTQPPPVSGPALVAEVPQAMTPVPLNAFQVIDQDIGRKLLVQSVNARRSAANTVQVSARVFNCTDRPLRILARTQFMDNAQFSTEPVSAWRLLIIESHGFATYEESSIGTTGATAFLIEARGAH